MRFVPSIRRTETPATLWPDTTRFFEDFFDDFPFGGSLLSRRDDWVPAVDVLEKDGSLVLSAELPGIQEKDIDLKLEGSVLTLKGERKMEKDDKKTNYHRVETFYGSFCRSFTLPDSVDTEKIKAEFKNGILTITIPHKPEIQPREIPVSVQ